MDSFKKTSYKSFSDFHYRFTKSTYNKFALKYADMWEWNKETFKEILINNIAPFRRFCKKNGKVLLAGSGTGRDYKLLSEKGFSCIGVDYSKTMIKEARKRTGGVFMESDIRDISYRKKYDGIYCESLLTHLSKKDAKSVLQKFFNILNNNGILYLAVKIGKQGIYVSDDIGGKRYYMVYDKNNFCNLVKRVGFDIIHTVVSDHTEKSRPKWFSLVGRKIH